MTLVATMALLLTGALAQDAASAPQGGPPAAPTGSGTPAAPSRFAVNRLDLIVNDQCVTRRDVMREIYRMAQPSSAEELNEMSVAVINARVGELLKTQAGKDQGFDENMVQRLVKDEIDRQEEQAGSASLFGDQLLRSQIDSGTYYQSKESMILAELWSRSVDGRFPGPGGRNYVDRYVRPGRLLFEYERNKGQLALPATVTLQELIVDAQRIGDLREAKDLADDLRARIALGEDFGEVAVASRAAPKDTEGILEPIVEERLMGVPGLAEFLASAEVGELSEVLPVRTDGVLRGFRVLKLLARERPEPPPFQDQAFQKSLTERIQENLDRLRVDVALSGLLSAAYVWPPEAFGRPGADAPEDPEAAATEGAGEPASTASAERPSP